MARVFIAITAEEKAAKQELIYKINYHISSRIDELDKIKESWDNGCITNREYVMRTKIIVCDISNGCDKLI